MKNFRKLFAMLLVMVLVAPTFVACGDDEPTEEIGINKTKKDLMATPWKLTSAIFLNDTQQKNIIPSQLAVIFTFNENGEITLSLMGTKTQTGRWELGSDGTTIIVDNTVVSIKSITSTKMELEASSIPMMDEEMIVIFKGQNDPADLGGGISLTFAASK